MEQTIKIIKSETELLKVRQDLHQIESPITISTHKRPKQTNGIIVQIDELHQQCKQRYEKVNQEIEQILRKIQHQEEIERHIEENKIFRNIDIFYRPVLNVYEPFNPSIYNYEKYRLQLRQKQAEKIIDELNEDKNKIEEYKRITTSLKHKKLPLTRPKCKDQTSPTAVSLVNVDILSNLI